MSENAWIEHDGNERPVAADALIEVKWWDGGQVMLTEDIAIRFNWQRNGKPSDPYDGDIIAYRLSGPSA